MEALFYRAERKNKYMKLNMENKKRIVVKVGTSTLTYPSGLMNLRKTERLVRCIADMQNSGRECLLVSSGAVSCGLAKIGLVGKPLSTEEKQAAAAVGQCELVDMYDRLFASYGHKIAQVLLTKDDLDSPVRSANASGTLKMLLGFGCIPVINENDTVSSEQLRIGSNDTLSAVVARLTDARSADQHDRHRRAVRQKPPRLPRRALHRARVGPSTTSSAATPAARAARAAPAGCAPSWRRPRALWRPASRW